MALQNDLQKTKLKNELKVKATEESAIREQVSTFVYWIFSRDYKTFFQIRDFILSGNIKEAEKVINSAYPELLDDDHLLHFYLQIQHLIELIRRKQIEQAVVFAQEDIVEKGDYPECLPDLERVMGLLAYPEPEKSPFSDLLKQNFRLKVWSRVNEGLVTKSM